MPIGTARSWLPMSHLWNWLPGSWCGSPLAGSKAREAVCVQRYSECGDLRWPPETICPDCMTRGGDWVDPKVEGEFWSFAVYHRAMNPAFADEVPYAVAMVRLTEGIEMIGRIKGPPDRIHIGQKVKAVFVDATDEVTLVLWEPSK